MDDLDIKHPSRTSRGARDVLVCRLVRDSRRIPALAQLSAYYHKPVQFSEVGLASQCCTLTQPFVYHSGAAPNLQAQQAYYAAACQAIRPYHIGIYWWAYGGLDPVASPTTDNSFTPYGKPAEQEMA